MLIAKITVNDVHANAVSLGKLTTGRVGAKVQFTFDSSWEGLSKTAVFRCMDIVKDVLNIDSEVTIPHEVLVRSGSPLYVGVYGTNADGTEVMPTVWATVGVVYSGADPSGDPSTERTPDVWEQLQNQINELKQQGASADAIKQAVDAYMAANPLAESDPTVPEWAKQPEPPKVELPTSLPNPNKLTLTGAVQAEYDGSKEVKVEIPESGGIEVTGASVGQTIVVKAVDDNGKPTEWETADLPQGGGESEWTHHETVTLDEAVSSVVIDLSAIEDCQEVAMYCNTKQEKADGTAHTALQKARILLNNSPYFIGWITNFSGHSGNLASFAHIENVGAFIKGQAWITTDVTYPSAVSANGGRVQDTNITKITIGPWPGNTFSAGSTFEIWYR